MGGGNTHPWPPAGPAHQLSQEEHMSTIEAAETTIPALPCVSLSETLPFYQLLGFQVTYQQKSPNPYAVVRRGGIELHFFGLKGLKPSEAYSTCIVVVPDVESTHAAFASALRQEHGKLPITGFPRITRMRPGQSRFTLVDPAGNSLIFVKRESSGEEKPESSEPKSKLAQAIDTAASVRDNKCDDAMAAKILDAALARKEPQDPVERARALAARTELAVALNDPERARALRDELRQIPLSAKDRKRLHDELEAADKLEQALMPVAGNNS